MTSQGVGVWWILKEKTLAEESLKRLLKILLMSLLNKWVNKSDNYKILSLTTVTA